jgi:hypothetical protein
VYPSPTIHRFLERARRRARLEVGLRHGALLGIAMVATLIFLAVVAASSGPAAFWPLLTTRVLPGFTLSVFALLLIYAWRKTGSNAAVARLVGRNEPAVSSDLLSAVELYPQSSPAASPELVNAFVADVGQRVEALELRRILPLRRAAWTLAGLGISLVLLLTLALAAKASFGRGLALLFHVPTRFEGASVSTKPLVGEVEVTYVYPPHTGMASRTIKDSSGDVVAPRGTHVALKMRALRRTRKVLLLFGEQGKGPEIEVQREGEILRTTFNVNEDGRYRVWMAPVLGQAVREDRGHRVQAQADQMPVAEIRAAADRIELPTPQPIEIAYGASDDYGLGPVDLVFRVGSAAEKRLALEDGKGRRSLKGKTTWDASAEALVPGVQIAYRIEARDNDAVSGPKTASSRTLYLVFQRPTETTEETIAQQREILDHLLAVLADRIELKFGLDNDRAMESDGRQIPTMASAAQDPPSHLLALQQGHDKEAEQIAQLGRIIDEQKRNKSDSKTLLASLSGIADRLNRHLRDESPLLMKLREKRDKNALALRELGAFHQQDRDHVAALEEACLLLDDLIGRQRLEDLAALSKELTDAHDRLKDLLERYRSTKDESLRQQLLSEIAALQKRIQELAQKVDAVRQRNDVPTEWQNMPDMRKAAAEAQKVQEAARKGDNEALEKALDDLGKSLDALKKSLEGNASEFNDERFPKESRALKELQRKVSELESDERGLSSDTQALSDEVQSARAESEKKRLAELQKAASEKMAELSKKLSMPPPDSAGNRAGEDHARAGENAERAARQMDEKDFSEARDEVAQIERNLERLQKSIARRLSNEKPGGELTGFSREMNEAKKLSEALGQALSEMLSQQQSANAEQKGRAGEQAGRQDGIEQRTRELANEAGKEGQGVPGFDSAIGELQGAAEQMQQAQQALKQGNVSEGLAHEKAAAERLARVRESMQQQQSGGRSQKAEPVAIPDETRAPRAWRQELLEAMKEKPPETFREQVRRYYEELVR